MNNFTPPPPVDPNEYPQLTNVWPAVEQNGMVSLHVNETSVRATYIDAITLAYMLLQTAQESAKHLGVSVPVYRHVMDDVQWWLDRGGEPDNTWK